VGAKEREHRADEKRREEKWDVSLDTPFNFGPEKVPPVMGIATREPLGPVP